MKPIAFFSALLAFLLICLLMCPSMVFSATLTGTVKNGTTTKPASGDTVILIKLGQGMEEAARTKTDAAGRFSVSVEDEDQPHLIRVLHQDVTYHRMAPPRTSSVEVEVYDVAKKVAGVNAVADLMYLQAGRGQLGISRIFAVNNTSQPPRTQMNDRNFEFYLPQDAQVDSAQAQTAGGQWVDSPAISEGNGQYAFNFPLRPGETEFQVSYHFAYSGHAVIDPKPLYPLDHFVVILPRVIQFVSSDRGVYEEKVPPTPPGAVAEVASHADPKQKLGFEITGEGILQDEAANSEASNEQSQAPSGPESQGVRPGGGLGPPIDAPDPLRNYRWYLLGGFALVLVAGAIYVGHHRQAVPESLLGPMPEGPTGIDPGKGPPRSEVLLEALKEELFQLEMEHKQGRISQAEYEKAKAALDQTLERALRRANLAG